MGPRQRLALAIADAHQTTREAARHLQVRETTLLGVLRQELKPPRHVRQRIALLYGVPVDDWGVAVAPINSGHASPAYTLALDGRRRYHASVAEGLYHLRTRRLFGPVYRATDDALLAIRGEISDNPNTNSPRKSTC